MINQKEKKLVKVPDRDKLRIVGFCIFIYHISTGNPASP